MRFGAFTLGLLAIATPLVAAWSKEDREIFRIRDEVSAHEEPGMTFYDVLGVSSTASYDEITKAHRKKSRSLHPDKIKKQLESARAKAAAAEGNKGKKQKPLTQAQLNAAMKEATERQSRLTLIANILKGPERDRYDHFLKNGFPVWKGTEYYYNRYRPGLGTVIMGLFIFAGGGIHYLALYMGWKRQREFIERYIKFARETAWGSADVGIPGVDVAPPPPPPPPAPTTPDEQEDGPPPPTNRRERRMQEKYAKRETGKEPSGRKAKKATAPSSAAKDTAVQQRSSGPTGAKKRVVAENGKVLVVDSLRDVYVEGEDEDGNVAEFLLDPDEIPRPTIHDTLLVRVPLFLYSSTVGRVISKQPAQTKPDASLESTPEPDRRIRDTTPKAIEIPMGDEESDVAQHTPATDSAEEFELLDRPAESAADRAKASGAQPASTKAGKRKAKRR